MPYFRCKNIKIKAVACAVPDDVEYTEEYTELFDKAYVEKFIKSTGVQRRYASHRNGVTASDLCCASAKKILDELGCDRGQIDVLIYASSSRDYEAPVTACVIQDRLGLSQDCACYDVPLGCSAYVYGLYLASTHLSTGCRSVLLLAGSAGDQLPESFVPSEIPMLYGNSGSATLLEACGEAGDVYGLLRSIGSQRECLLQPYGGQRHPFWMMAEELGLQGAAELNGKLYMDGLEVMRFSLREVVQLVKDFCRHFNAGYDDYEIFACHQANRLIINNLARKIRFPQEKIPLPIVNYGNTGCGSVPLAICDYYTEHPSDKTSSQVLACGFGIGLSLGIVGVTLDPSKCFPVITVQDRFDDGITYEKFH